MTWQQSKLVFFVPPGMSALPLVLPQQTKLEKTVMVQVNEVEQTIKDLEKAETEAFLNEDYEGLNRIWHSEFSVNTPLNIILKTADIQGAMKAGLIRYSLLERHIEQIMLHDHVVVTLGHELTIPIDDAPMAGKKVTRRFTNIWVKEGDRWQMLSRHASNSSGE